MWSSTHVNHLVPFILSYYSSVKRVIAMTMENNWVRMLTPQAHIHITNKRTQVLVLGMSKETHCLSVIRKLPRWKERTYHMAAVDPGGVISSPLFRSPFSCASCHSVLPRSLSMRLCVCTQHNSWGSNNPCADELYSRIIRATRRENVRMVQLREQSLSFARYPHIRLWICMRVNKYVCYFSTWMSA